MGSELIDLTGQRFGSWTVLSYFRKNRTTYWRCQCDCGGIYAVQSPHLRRGESFRCRPCAAKEFHKHSSGPRDNTTMITWCGRTHPLKEWSAILGIKYQTLTLRLSRGHDPLWALTYRADPALLVVLNPSEDDIPEVFKFGDRYRRKRKRSE